MRIAVNTRLLIANKMDGIGRYAFEILKRITIKNPQVEFHFIFDRPFSKKFIFSSNIIPHVLTPSARHPMLWYIWFELQLPKLLKKINPDVFFSPDGFIPTQSKYHSIATIHDINFEHRPKDLPWSHSLYYRHFFKKYAHRTKHIITVSQFCKEDIASKYNIDKKKISVIYNGVSNKFRRIDEEEKLQIKNKYTKGKEFFIFIGSLHKRKNINNVLKSFEKYKMQSGKYKFLIAGEQKWINQETRRNYNNMKFKKDVIFLGRVADNELPVILGSAKALCFTSLFEGFGLPIIEAMKASVPVITSNISSMPEIAKESAIIVNPYDTREITHALWKIEKNTKLIQKIVDIGNERVQLFKWEKSAEKTWQILKNSVKNGCNKI